MVNTINNKGIKTLRVLILMVVLATAAVVVFQVKWLQTGYQTAKDQLKVEGDRIASQVFIEQRELVTDTIKKLLKKVIKSESDFKYKIQTYTNHETNILYTNPSPTASSYIGYQLTGDEIALAKTNPYELFWKKVNESDFKTLNHICAKFLLNSNFKFPPGSEKAKIEAQIAQYYGSSLSSSKTFLRLATREVKKINKDIKVSMAFMEEINKSYKKQFTNENDSTAKVVEVALNPLPKMRFEDKLDSLNATVKRLNEKGKLIFVMKPIFDGKDFETLNKIPFLVLILDAPTSYLLGQMLTSIISSTLLMLLIGSILTYMIYLIIKQRKLSDLKNDFINNMSHELKTPVATALAAIQGLQYFDVLNDKGKTENYLNTAATELKRLSTMITSILNSAVFESGNFVLTQTRFNLREMLTELSGSLIQHSKKNVLINVSDNTDVEIFGDRSHLYNVFTNMIDNAIKYSDERVEIDIVAQKTTDGTKIKISDNGNGIPLTYQKNIFDQFFRVPNQDDHSIKGHGLGLNYVRSVIEKHGGDIVLTQSSSAGSTFEINLPQ